MISPDIGKLASEVIAAALRRPARLATAESCTGGLIGAALTDVAGSSAVFDRGYVTYSNAAKHQMLGVEMHVFETVGAVSHDVARSMAEGAKSLSDVDFAVSVTGIAGPGGGSTEKPVGLVYFGLADAHGVQVERHLLSGMDRQAVREASVMIALTLLLNAVSR